MSHSLRLIKIIQRVSGEWSAAQTFSPEVFGLPEIHIFLNIKYKIIADDTVLNLNELGLKIIKDIRMDFYANKEFNDHLLKNTLDIAFKKNLNNEYIIQVCVAARIDDKIYLASVGGGVICVLRDNAFLKLLVSNEEVVFASGVLMPNDWYILSQRELLETYDEARIKRALSSGDENYISQYFSGRREGFSKNEVSIAFLRVLKREPAIEKSFVETIGQDNDNYRKSKIITWGKHFFRKFIQTTLVDDDIRRSRKNAIIGMVLILVLVALSVYGVDKRKDKQVKQSYESTLSEALYKYEESINLKGVDKNLSQKNFLESEVLIKSLRERNIQDPKISELELKIEENRGIVLGIYNLNPERYLDLTLIKENFLATQMTFSGETSYVLDKNMNTVVLINLKDKRSELVKGIVKERKINTIASYLNSLFVFDEGEIYRIRDGQAQTIDKSFTNDYLVYSYAGNVYAIDKSTNSIWRYAASGDSYSERRSWLSETNSVDLNNSIDLAIDGNIWILSTGPKILVLTSGLQRSFNLNNFSQVVNINSIYTDENSENIYLLDKENGAITSITKEGVYVAQFRSEKIKEVLDFVVYEKNKQVFLLTSHEILYSSIP